MTQFQMRLKKKDLAFSILNVNNAAKHRVISKKEDCFDYAHYINDFTDYIAM